MSDITNNSNSGLENAPSGLKPRSGGNRWYDNRPKVSRSVLLISALPPDVQSIIAKGIVTMANDEFKAHETLQSLRSLGSDKVMSLHKAQKKQRAIDTNPHMHQAMSYLYILSPENQDVLAERIIELMGFIREYFDACKKSTQEPTEKHIIDLTDSYVQSGSDEAKRFLSQIEEHFLKGVALSVQLPNAEEVHEDQGGMRIRD